MSLAAQVPVVVVGLGSAPLGDAVIVENVIVRAKDFGVLDGSRVASQDVVPVRLGAVPVAVVGEFVDLVEGPDVVLVGPILSGEPVAGVQSAYVVVVQGTVDGKAVHGVSQQRPGRHGLFSHLGILCVFVCDARY